MKMIRKNAFYQTIKNEILTTLLLLTQTNNVDVITRLQFRVDRLVDRAIEKKKEMNG